jgi:arginine decarboxylase
MVGQSGNCLKNACNHSPWIYRHYRDEYCEYVDIRTRDLEKEIADGLELVSASFVIPYPPGFPILVPGQIISADIIIFMKKLDVTEIHGYQPELGLQVFTKGALEQASV